MQHSRRRTEEVPETWKAARQGSPGCIFLLRGRRAPASVATSCCETAVSREGTILAVWAGQGDWGSHLVEVKQVKHVGRGRD